MSCLMEALQDKRIRLQPECKKRLQDRIDMWSYAAKVHAPSRETPVTHVRTFEEGGGLQVLSIKFSITRIALHDLASLNLSQDLPRVGVLFSRALTGGDFVCLALLSSHYLLQSKLGLQHRLLC